MTELAPLLISSEVVHLMHQKGEEHIGEGAARSLVGQQVLRDRQQGRILKGGIEEDGDVSANLSRHAERVNTKTNTKKKNRQQGGKEAFNRVQEA